VIISQKGWLRARQGHDHDVSQFNFKAGDALYDALECRSTGELVAFSDTGRVYTVAISSLPSARGDGQPITSMIDIEHGSRIVHMVAGDPGQRYVIGVRSGYGFITQMKNLTTRQRAGKQFITLDEGDTLMKPAPLRSADNRLAMLSQKGRFLVVDLAEFKTLSGGGRGTIMMALDAPDVLAQWVAAGPQGIVAQGVYRNKDTTIALDGDALAEYHGKRARKGKVLSIRIKQPTLLPA
jgi:topoisomerase-4 subunit A